MSTTPSRTTRDRVRRWVVVTVLTGTAQLAVTPAAFAGGRSCFFSWGEESSGGFVASSSSDTRSASGAGGRAVGRPGGGRRGRGALTVPAARRVRCGAAAASSRAGVGPTRSCSSSP